MGLKIQTRIGNVVREFVDDSRWSMDLDFEGAYGGKERKREVASPKLSDAQRKVFGLGLKAGKKISFDVAVTPFSQFVVMNPYERSAGQIEFGGIYLPNWERRYIFDCHQFDIGANLGIGAEVPSIKLPIPVKVSIDDTTLKETKATLPIVRMRMAGAPPAASGGQQFTAGDPTGFLGVGLMASAGGEAKFKAMKFSATTRLNFFGSNFLQTLRDLIKGDVAAGVARAVKLLERNHLQYMYAGITTTNGAYLTNGSGALNLGAAELSVRFGPMFIPRLHLVVRKPGESAWRYVYTVSMQPNLQYSKRYVAPETGWGCRPKGMGKFDPGWFKGTSKK
jgi:hypothetical protein